MPTPLPIAPHSLGGRWGRLLLWLKDWNALGTANNRKDAPNTFLVNTIRALAHVVEVSLSPIPRP